MYNRFTLLYSRNQHNILNQLDSNKKILKCHRKDTPDLELPSQLKQMF